MFQQESNNSKSHFLGTKFYWFTHIFETGTDADVDVDIEVQLESPPSGTEYDPDEGESEREDDEIDFDEDDEDKPPEVQKKRGRTAKLGRADITAVRHVTASSNSHLTSTTTLDGKRKAQER
jgi:hypothetical protein